MTLLADTLGADVQALRQDFQAWMAPGRRFGGAARGAHEGGARGQERGAAQERGGARSPPTSS